MAGSVGHGSDIRTSEWSHEMECVCSPCGVCARVRKCVSVRVTVCVQVCECVCVHASVYEFVCVTECVYERMCVTVSVRVYQLCVRVWVGVLGVLRGARSQVGW